MKISKWILPSILVITVSVVSFTKISLRTQGRIVEFCTLGDWPLEWAIRTQFERKQPELRAIVEFANEAPEVGGLRVTPLGLQASLKGNKAEKNALDKPNILQALVSIEAQLANIEEDSVGVLLGSEVRGSTSFEVSFVYPLMEMDIPDCGLIVAAERAKIGGCGFRLNSSWYAKYVWYPDDVYELEKAMEGLK